MSLLELCVVIEMCSRRVMGPNKRKLETGECVVLLLFLRWGNHVSERPFKPIRLKTPPSASLPFPSTISSVQDARKFVNSHIDSAKRTELHWKLAISALHAVVDRGSYDHARKAMHHALATEGWLAG
jgi:hypothetical protein